MKTIDLGQLEEGEEYPCRICGKVVASDHDGEICKYCVKIFCNECFKDIIHYCEEQAHSVYMSDMNYRRF